MQVAAARRGGLADLEEDLDSLDRRDHGAAHDAGDAASDEVLFGVGLAHLEWWVGLDSQSSGQCGDERIHCPRVKVGGPRGDNTHNCENTKSPIRIITDCQIQSG